jgi:hypothetical protein
MRFVRIVSSARRKTLPASSQNTCRWSASLAVGVMWANVIPERFQSRIRQSSRPVWVRAGADSEGLVARTGIETNVSIFGIFENTHKTRVNIGENGPLTRKPLKGRCVDFRSFPSPICHVLSHFLAGP